MRPIWIHRGPPNRTFDGLGCLVGSDGASWAIPAKADDGAYPAAPWVLQGPGLPRVSAGGGCSCQAAELDN